MRMPARGGAFDRGVLDRHVDAIGDLVTGATHAGGDVTLAPNATATPVTDRNCTAASMVMVSPLSASAASAKVWVQSLDRGLFILGHDLSAATDRKFHYEIRRRA